jgi:hypothetical protein
MHIINSHNSIVNIQYIVLLYFSFFQKRGVKLVKKKNL